MCRALLDFGVFLAYAIVDLIAVIPRGEPSTGGRPAA